MPRTAAVLYFILCFCRLARAQEQDTEYKPQRKIPPGVSQQAASPSPQTPALLRWMLHPLDRGMLISLPIIDTNPNRGVTVGVMPIWVLKQKSGGERIEQIFAPSLTHNSN